MRRNLCDIQKPPYIDDETKRYGCLTWVDETLTYFINRHNRQYLLWSFWYSFAEFSYYEDPHLENDFFKALTTLQNWVPYCETVIIKRSDISSRAQNYPKVYRISLTVWISTLRNRSSSSLFSRSERWDVQRARRTAHQKRLSSADICTSFCCRTAHSATTRSLSGKII